MAIIRYRPGRFLFCSRGAVWRTSCHHPQRRRHQHRRQGVSSYVAFTAGGQMLVGEPARRQATSNPEGTTSAFKRRMGRRENFRLRDKDYSPEQLSALLLQKIKRDAEAFLGEPVEKAVVTVPAYFDDIFGGLNFDFGGGSSFEGFFHRRRTGPVRGANIKVGLTIPLERVASGGEEKVRLSRPPPAMPAVAQVAERLSREERELYERLRELCEPPRERGSKEGWSFRKMWK